MNVLIVGRGWVANKMMYELRNRHHVITVTPHEIVFDVLKEHTFDWVVNCAGVTGTPNVDACENDKVGTMMGNAVFPVLLYEECHRLGVRMSHFSSGCIYEGNILTTDAEPNFFGSIYSISKGISDSYLKNKAQVYRIRMPFTSKDEPKNYLTKILKYAKSGKLIEAGPNSLTDLDEAVRIACDLIESNAPDAPYNLVNQGSITMHELVELLGITPSWFTAEEFKDATIASRSNCVIPSYESMRPIKEALQEAIDTLLDKPHKNN
jgi:dTDP-4-dehydrorhamnose reductase